MTRASHQDFISNELSRTDLTQTTNLHMTERDREKRERVLRERVLRERVMMTKLGGFPPVKILGSHKNRSELYSG